MVRTRVTLAIGVETPADSAQQTWKLFPVRPIHTSPESTQTFSFVGVLYSLDKASIIARLLLGLVCKLMG